MCTRESSCSHTRPRSHVYLSYTHTHAHSHVHTREQARECLLDRERSSPWSLGRASARKEAEIVGEEGKLRSANASSIPRFFRSELRRRIRFLATSFSSVHRVSQPSVVYQFARRNFRCSSFEGNVAFARVACAGRGKWKNGHAGSVYRSVVGPETIRKSREATR